MKKLLTFGMAMTMAMGALTGCGGSDTQQEDTTVISFINTTLP